MGKKKLWLGVLATVLLSSLLFVGIGSAHSFRAGNTVNVGQNEVVNETLFIAGNSVDVNSEVFGDIFCVGQNVNITGTVHGDVMCAGQTVRVTGKVDGSVRLAGQTVTVGAEVVRNATIGAQTFTLESTGKIGEDVTIGAQDAYLNGDVGRDVAVGASGVTISSKIGRNIKASVEQITLASTAKVGGAINYTSWNQINQAPGSEVAGSVTRSDPPKKEDGGKHGAVFGFGLAWFIYLLVAMLFTSMILALLFPRMFQSVTDRAIPTPWRALLTGFLASIVAPILGILLLISVVGIPLAFIAGLAWLLLLLLSGPVAAYYVGRLVIKDKNNALLYMLVGSAILLVLYFIPFIGFLALLFAFWLGTGMLLLELFRRTGKPAYSTVETKPQPAVKKAK